MAKIKYRCDDNGHEFDGNDFTEECLECGSRNITPLSNSSLPWDKVKEFILNNKIAIGILGILILLILIFSYWSDDSQEDEFEYEITISQAPGSPFLEVKMTGKLKEDNKKINIDPKKVLSYIERKVIVNNDSAEIKDDNLIYLCPSDTGAVTVSITPKPRTKLKNDKTKIPVQGGFYLNGIPVSSKADCPLQTSEVDVIPSNNCKLNIIIRRDLKGKEVLVSVNGENGTYENRLSWERKPLINTKQNVWVKLAGSARATPAMHNHEIIPEAGCVPIDNTVVKNEFIRLANEFGKDPQNRSAQMAFQSFVNKTFTHQNIGPLNDKSMGDLSDLQNEMRILAVRDGTKFRLQGKPEISKDGSTITFRFQEY